jgi:probable F420-dependent oxidoreductase
MTRPLETLGAVLDTLDGAGVPADARVLAALGPNVLALERDRASGAYPYLVTPAYVADARSRLGPDRLLAVLVMTAPPRDRELVGRAATAPLSFLTAQGGFRRDLLRLGFSEADIDNVSDGLLDGVLAWGDDGAIGSRIAEYRPAGADQVVLRLLDISDDLPAKRDRLAWALLR